MLEAGYGYSESTSLRLKTFGAVKEIYRSASTRGLSVRCEIRDWAVVMVLAKDRETHKTLLYILRPSDTSNLLVLGDHIFRGDFAFSIHRVSEEVLYWWEKAGDRRLW